MKATFKLISCIALYLLYNSSVSFGQDLVIWNQRELFIDNYLLDTLYNVDMRLATPVSGGTALKFDKPWEGQFSGYVSVIKDSSRYRMYYRGVGAGKGASSQVTCYAESVDGMNWKKPNLRLFKVNGTLDNNVVMTGNMQQSTHNLSVFYDGRDGIPEAERYKAVGGVSTYDRPSRGLFRYVSADGINWKRYKKDTTALFIGYALDSQNILTWLPSENCYAIYLRTWTGDKPGDEKLLKGTRTIARSVSKDFMQWSEPEMMEFGDAPLENLYTNATQPYFRAPQILISMPFRFSPEKKVLSDMELKNFGTDPSQWKGVADAVLMTSRGGNVYNRKFMESFVRPGFEQKNWAARSNIPALGIIPTGSDKMSFFLSRAYGTKDSYLERMELRTDGFASLHAGFSEGYAITKPLILSGKSFSINFSTSSIGHVKVILLGEDGKELQGFQESDAEIIVGDKVDREVRWKSGKTVKDLGKKKIRVKFIAKDADIYSFAISDE